MNQIISDQVRWTTSDLELLTTDEGQKQEQAPRENRQAIDTDGGDV